jgi:hypothetical protein
MSLFKLKVFLLNESFLFFNRLCLRLFFFLSPVLFFVSEGKAQAIEQNPSEYFSFEPVFKKDYVVHNRIKSIRSALVYKRDNQEIEDKGLSKCWDFDSIGQLKRYYATSVHGYVNKEVEHPARFRRGRKISGPYTTLEPVYSFDTTFTNYYYNHVHQIIIRRNRDGDYYNSVYYEYDSIGNIKKQSVFKETNASENRNMFKLGVQNLISTESFKYVRLSPRQLKRKHLNDEGKVYKETILNYDSIGRVLEENSSFTVSWMRSSLKLQYNKSGQLLQKINTSNENGDEQSKSIYTYVEGNLLDVEHRYTGDLLMNDFTYIYDRKTKQLNSHFIREFQERAIVIARYSYEYY